MKLLCTFFILFTVLAHGATEGQNDADISKALVGTWTPMLSEQTTMHSRIIYYADGHGVQLLWAASQPESTALRIETRWFVTNSTLVLTSVKSSNPQIIPIGVELRDHIISISADRFVFEPTDGYGNMEKKKSVRIREQTTPTSP